MDEKGNIFLEKLSETIREDTILVSTMMVNNETGAVLPIEEIGRLVHEKNPQTTFHVDAIQAYGKYRIYPKKWNIDLLSQKAFLKKYFPFRPQEFLLSHSPVFAATPLVLIQRHVQKAL